MPCTHKSCSSHGSYWLRSFFFVLLAAGSALSAQPAAHKPLPETAVLDRVDGRLLHVDANDTWLFELSMEVKTPDYRLPAGTRFVLLPSAMLARLIADVNDRAAPRYRLSARITRYQGRNYLFPTYYLPLSAFKSDQKPEGERQKTEESSTNPKSETRNPKSNEPELAIPPEILEQLKKQPPLRGPRRSTPAQKPAQEIPERVLVDCVGRIESMQSSLAGCQPPTAHRPPAPENSLTGLVFIPYALGRNISNVQYELLPSAALEETLQKQTHATDPIRFNVAGLVAEFKGRKYLLLQRAVVVYNYGNFGK